MKSINRRAFPVSRDHIDSHDYNGLTKREYFAGMIAKGLSSRLDHTRPKNMIENEARRLADAAVIAADALIESLKNK